MRCTGKYCQRFVNLHTLTMDDFPKKIDLFTAFAAQKITNHSKEITVQTTDQSLDWSENSFPNHEQLLEEELTNKIQELSCSCEVLEPSLKILKQYYINLFRSRLNMAGGKLEQQVGLSVITDSGIKRNESELSPES